MSERDERKIEWAAMARAFGAREWREEVVISDRDLALSKGEASEFGWARNRLEERAGRWLAETLRDNRPHIVQTLLDLYPQTWDRSQVVELRLRAGPCPITLDGEIARRKEMVAAGTRQERQRLLALLEEAADGAGPDALGRLAWLRERIESA